MTRDRSVETRPGGKWEDAPFHRFFGLGVYPDYAQGAFYLLSAGAAHKPDVWLAFFGRSPRDETAPGRHEDLFNVYAHQDVDAPRDAPSRSAASSSSSNDMATLSSPPPSRRTRTLRPFWRAALLPETARVRTHYRNGTSLELARIALFAHAWRADARNFKFVLISESCVPLHPLSYVHSVLTRDERPRIHEIMTDQLLSVAAAASRRKQEPPESSGKSRQKRWVSSLSPLLPEERKGALLTARQWVIASRKEVEHYPTAVTISELFGSIPRAEEHAFFNVLTYGMGYRRGVDIDIGCVTFQRFPQGGKVGNRAYRVPLACRNISSHGRGLELERERDMLRARRPENGGCLFARKFAASCDLHCLAESDFASFRRCS